MVVDVRIGIIEPPHVRITEKNLKHTKIAFIQQKHLLSAETEQLLRARRMQPQGSHTWGHCELCKGAVEAENRDPKWGWVGRQVFKGFLPKVGAR